jgi:hypothetical protein
MVSMISQSASGFFATYTLDGNAPVPAPRAETMSYIRNERFCPIQPYAASQRLPSNHGTKYNPNCNFQGLPVAPEELASLDPFPS